jgi:hypothetical protein
MVLALFSIVHTFTFLELNIPMMDAAKFYLHWHWHIALKRILLWQILTELEEYRTDWIPNFSGTELFGYKNYRILNVSDKQIWPALSMSDTELT